MEPLVMVPGLGSDAAVWERTIQALGTAAECRVGDTLSDDSLAGMAARILAAAPQRFSLAGLSMGGMVALEVMRAAPHRVARLAPSTPARGPTPRSKRRNGTEQTQPSRRPATSRRWRPAACATSSIPKVPAMSGTR